VQRAGSISSSKALIDWEDFLVLIFNASRFAAMLAHQAPGMSQARHTANTGVSAALFVSIAGAKTRATTRIQILVDGLKDRSISPFRFEERNPATTDGDKLLHIISLEVARLEQLKTDLALYPQSRCPAGSLDGTVAPDGLPEPDLPFGKRSPAERQLFYNNFANQAEVLASLNKGTAGWFEFLKSLENPAFLTFEFQQCCFIADLMFEKIIRTEIVNDMVAYANQLRLRRANDIVDKSESAAQKQFFCS
jgi:hypothetical protein